jgi:methyltransferase (TIGR00027 family)
MTDTVKQPPISRTSIYVAAARAVGAREPDASVRNPDNLAERLLGDPDELNVDHPVVRALKLDYDEAMKDIEVAGIVRMMIVRTRFIDETLERAIAAGATQIVILGAGFDSIAYRHRDRLTHVRVFEVDRAATEELKMQRVADRLGQRPPNLTYVPLDFQHDDLRDVLVRHGFDPAQRTLFVLEGVTMYLPEDAARKTFAFIASHEPGSRLVFDFVYRAMVDMIARIDLNNAPAGARPFLQRFLDLTRDEPWLFGVPTGAEREFLAEFGLDLHQVLTIGGEEAARRYLTRPDGTEVGGQTLAEAMAGRAEQARAAAASAPADQQITPERWREQHRLMSYQLAEAFVGDRTSATAV